MRPPIRLQSADFAVEYRRAAAHRVRRRGAEVIVHRLAIACGSKNSRPSGAIRVCSLRGSAWPLSAVPNAFPRSKTSPELR